MGLGKTLLAAFIVFFSSRRRHTRSLCDWSSDVCSSDLAGLSFRLRVRNGERLSRLRENSQEPWLHFHRWRSEERRVGKECRSWGSTYELKKKNKLNTRMTPSGRLLSLCYAQCSMSGVWS